MSWPCAPTCGLTHLSEALAEALSGAPSSPERLLILSSGGCAGFVAAQLAGAHRRIPLARSLPFAMGLAEARPNLDVLAILGDGEVAGAGVHHLVHAARRGDRVRALVVDNAVLEEAGGFPSPTTPRGGRTAAAPDGASFPPLDIAELARAAGAAWVGRETLGGGASLRRLLSEFLAAPRFALLEVRAPCYRSYGQWNGYPTPDAMREALEALAVREPTGSGASLVGGGRFRVGRLWPMPETP